MEYSTSVSVYNIPLPLQERPQWVLWERVNTKNGRSTKVPHSANTGKVCDPLSPSNQVSFAVAVNAMQVYNATGIGFVLMPGGGIVGGDLDNCIDPHTQAVAPWALTIQCEIDTYWEVSPSGLGLRCFVFGTLPEGGRRRDGIEFYGEKHFLTATGHHVPGTSTTLRLCTGPLDTVYKRVFVVKPSAGKPVSKRANRTQPDNEEDRTPNNVRPNRNLPDDSEIIRVACNAKNGRDFATLYAGEWEGKGYPSQSEADLALCRRLAFYTGPDEVTIDRLFRKSGLYREKWERDDYRDDTIRKALSGCTEFYCWACSTVAEVETQTSGVDKAKRALAHVFEKADMPKLGKEKLTAEEWQRHGKRLKDWKAAQDDKYRWEVGLWYNMAPVPFGKREEVVERLFGKTAGTVRRWAAVVKAFPPERREPGVPFWVYLEIVSRPEEEQMQRLQSFRTKPINRDELRALMGVASKRKEYQGWDRVKRYLPAQAGDQIADAIERDGSSIVLRKLLAALGIGAYEETGPAEQDIDTHSSIVYQYSDEAGDPIEPETELLDDAEIDVEICRWTPPSSSSN